MNLLLIFYISGFAISKMMFILGYINNYSESKKKPNLLFIICVIMLLALVWPISMPVFMSDFEKMDIFKK